MSERTMVPLKKRGGQPLQRQSESVHSCFQDMVIGPLGTRANKPTVWLWNLCDLKMYWIFVAFPAATLLVPEIIQGQWSKAAKSRWEKGFLKMDGTSCLWLDLVGKMFEWVVQGWVPDGCANIFIRRLHWCMKDLKAGLKRRCKFMQFAGCCFRPNPRLYPQYYLVAMSR